MNEILPGTFHWTAVHPNIKIPVSSYWLRDEGVLLDPLLPGDGADALDPAPQHILLTNRHHYRASAALVERFGCTVWCVEQGLHEFGAGQVVRSFRFGDTLPGDIESIEIGQLCPDETALLIPRIRALAIADGIVRRGDGPLGFVPDAYIGDDADGVKAALKRGYARLMDRDFDHLLLAHGNPWVGGGKDALRVFCG